MVSIGSQRLAAVCKRRKLSERRAAALVECSFAAMHRYMVGERAPLGAVLFRIEKVFGIDAALFFKEPKTATKPAA